MCNTGSNVIGVLERLLNIVNIITWATMALFASVTAQQLTIYDNIFGTTVIIFEDL